MNITSRASTGRIPVRTGIRARILTHAAGQQVAVEVETNPNTDPEASVSYELEAGAKPPPRSPFQTGGMARGTRGGRSMAPADSLPLTATKQIVFIRHGLSSWNEEGRIQGSSNFSHLTAFGREQVRFHQQVIQFEFHSRSKKFVVPTTSTSNITEMMCLCGRTGCNPLFAHAK